MQIAATAMDDLRFSIPRTQVALSPKLACCVAILEHYLPSCLFARVSRLGAPVFCVRSRLRTYFS